MTIDSTIARILQPTSDEMYATAAQIGRENERSAS